MKWFENRKLACFICVLIVVFSSFCKSQITFAKFYNDAETVFVNGMENDGYSIQSDCEKKVAIASNLYAIAKKNLNQSTSSMDAMEQVIDQFKRSETIEEKAVLMEQLDQTYDLLLNLLNESPLNAKDKDYLIMLTSDYDGRSDMIKRNGYHHYVDELLKKTEGFPASILYSLSNHHLMRFVGGTHEN